MVRILIADDHPIFRDALKTLLGTVDDFAVAGEVADGRTAVAEVRELDPDILLLDLSMPRMNGLDALREVSRLEAHTRTLLLTAGIAREELVASLRFGARGVVLKESATAVLLEAIRVVMRGEYWVGHESMETLSDALRLLDSAPQLREAGAYHLSDRELQIIAAIVDGHGNRRIAEKLSISEKTVKHHLTSIYGKLGVENRLELALFALQRQLNLPALPPDR